MKTIYKYPLELAESSFVKIPFESRILHVGNQGQTICLWVEVDTISPYTGKEPILEDREFLIVGTGHKVPENVDYLGTVIIGLFVWHIYEKRT